MMGALQLWEDLPKMRPFFLESQEIIVIVEMTSFFMTMDIGIVFLMKITEK